MIKSKLPNNVLGKIWKLADVDRDGMLDADEFALAMHLMNIKLDGEINWLLEDFYNYFNSRSRLAHRVACTFGTSYQEGVLMSDWQAQAIGTDLAE